MKRRLLYPGALLAFAISPMALAETDVLVYGQAHLAMNVLDDGDDYSAMQLSSNLSRIGFRAQNTFSPQLRGMAQIEGTVDISSNQDIALTSRNSFLGLAGDWGMFRAGYFDSANKVLRTRTDLFGNQLGDARNVLRGNYDGNQGFDERFRNSVAYRTPTLNGFSADLHYSAETVDENDAEDSNDNDAMSGSVTFEMGGLYAALAHERWNFQDPAEDRNITRLAAGYSMESWRFVGLVQRATDPADKGYSLGARYQHSERVALRTQYTWMDADDSDFDATQLAVGADYQYAPELRFYINYAQLSNGEQQTLAPWRAASTLSQSGAADETARAVSLGAIYSF